MTESKVALVPVYRENDEISLWTLASVLVRHRRLIVAFAVVGAALGLSSGLLSTRVYTSKATFIPQGSEAGQSVVSATAAQLGFRVMASGSESWGPALYVELLRSRDLLEPIVLSTITVAEEGGQRVTVMDLLGITAPTLDRRIDLAHRALAAKIGADQEPQLGAVKLWVTTKWPSVSLQVAERLLTGMNEFNSKTRKSQATAERQFVEAQVADAEAQLRAAEDRLEAFLQRNRVTEGAPQLAFERDRLQRAVNLRETLHASWLQSREAARIREVRDIPVITVIEKPQLPIVGEPRKSVQKAVVGGLVWGALGLLVAFLLQGVKAARRASSEEAGEFFRLIDDATPRFLRKRKVRGA